MQQGHVARAPFFAIKFLRLIHESGAVAVLKSEGLAFLSAVVVAEDRLRFQRAVTFWNEQMARALGVKDVSTVKRLRRKLQELGWLGCSTGRHGRPPEYWVQIPDEYRPLFEEEVKPQEQTELSGANLPHVSEGSGANLHRCKNAPVQKRPGTCPQSAPLSSLDLVQEEIPPNPPEDGGVVVSTDPSPQPEPVSEALLGPLRAALAKVTGRDPATDPRGFDRALSGLVSTAQPPYTPSEVLEFGERFHELCPAAKDRRSRPGLTEVRKNIGLVRSSPRRKPPARPAPSLFTRPPVSDDRSRDCGKMEPLRAMLARPEWGGPPRSAPGPAPPEQELRMPPEVVRWLDEAKAQDAELTAQHGSKPGHLLNLVVVAVVKAGGSSDMATWTTREVDLARAVARETIDTFGRPRERRIEDVGSLLGRLIPGAT